MLFENLIQNVKLFSANPLLDDIVGLQRLLRDKEIEHWLNETLFSFNWWLLLITTIAIFILWIIILDKNRIIEIAGFGLLVGTVAFILDTTGASLVLWTYPDKLIPMMLPIVEIHKVHLPIIYMIIYQYFQTWKSYMITLIITSTVFTFVLEPLTVWLGIYKTHHWKHIYSLPIYIFIGWILRWVLIKVKQIEKKQ